VPTSKKTAKMPDITRKLIAFDQETWRALDLLARDSMKSIQELADEAFRDLLQKHGRPSDLKAALRQSAQQHPSSRTVPSGRREPRR
jgi:Antitoxin-like ribbon-helix-helix